MSVAVRRAVLAAASTSAVVVMLLSFKPHHSEEMAAAQPAPTAPPPRSVPSPPPGGSHPVSGTYTGDAVPTKYGTVQVTATVKDGRLTSVKALHTPSGDDHSRQLAASSVPRLTKEALGAHSAHIDAVSGASYTSQGYVQSLQSALDKAGI
ncbi:MULTISPECIES: FMN-binding protein [unclassified Streptomyces]|uniref:FMN-binding protein n=1 Tax=unclassified Streptomyces TaxID=2593676 RepID=UPI002E22DAE4|nr:FMN-binding protein [Streptomyces sp. NBC_01023]